MTERLIKTRIHLEGTDQTVTAKVPVSKLQCVHEIRGRGKGKWILCRRRHVVDEESCIPGDYSWCDPFMEVSDPKRFAKYSL